MRMTRRVAALTAWAAGACALLALGAARAQLPPGATPGGAIPRVDQPGLPSARDEGPLVPIPPAVDRPLEVDEGERLFVSGFRLEGVEDVPERGIERVELESIVEQMRIERQALDQVDERGFTADERGQIADFMRKVVASPDLDMRFEEYEALVDELRALKAERDAGMTIGEIQQIAAAVTQYYRSAGYVLAQAYVPVQEVVDGQVTIQILPGVLGDVVVEGNEHLSDELLAAPFDELIDAPVTADGIETAILSVSDYPGVSAFGVFQPGEDVGETNMVVRVQNEEPFYATVRLDNHGTRFTGRERVFAEMTWNNPTLAGDTLTGTFLYQFDPDNSWFGSVEYERPFLRPGLSIGVAAQKNPFDVGAELLELGFSGESEVLRLFTRKTLLRSRQRNAFAYLGFKRSDSESRRDDVLIAEDKLAMIEAEIDYDSIETEARAINLASMGLGFGLGDVFGASDRNSAANAEVQPSRQGSNGQYASNEFWKVTASYSRLQKMTDTQSLLVRLEGQWSRSLLTSLEQFDVGGPASVRAYPVSELLADSALFASLEYTFDAPGFADQPAGFRGLTWGEVLRVSFFADFAHGRINKANPGDIAVFNRGGYGAAAAFNIPGDFDARVQYAHKIGRPRASDGDSARWWVDVNFHF